MEGKIARISVAVAKIRIIGLVNKTTFNTKLTKIEGKIPHITDSATINHVSQFAKKLI